MFERLHWLTIPAGGAVIFLGLVAWTGEGVGRRNAQEQEEQQEQEQENEQTVTATEVPAAALAALKKLAASANIEEFSREVEHGHTFYEGSWKSLTGTNLDVLVTESGDLMEIEEEISAGQVPAAVRAAGNEAAGKDAALEFEKKTTVLYEVKFEKGEKRHELLLTPDGRRVEEEIEKGKER